MADNTVINVGSGGDIISTDAITTLNGGAIVTGEKAQRVKVGSGVDGTFDDATSTTPIPVRNGDGTNQITVKAASTAAVATDTAEVVALHPTSPLPAGTNTMGSVKITDGTNVASVAAGASQNGVRVAGLSLATASQAILAAGTGTAGPLTVSDGGNVTFIAKNTVAASAWAGAPVLVFEQSDDGTSWSPLTVIRSDTNAVNSTFTLGVNTANTEIMFDAALEGVSQVRCRVTTGPTTNGMTIVIVPGTMPFEPIVATIDRKDAGRTPVVLYVEAVAGATTEALVTMTQASAGGTTATGTSFAVPAGKTLRLTSMTVAFVSTTTTANTSKIRIRANTAGAAVIGSNISFSYPRIGWNTSTIASNLSATYVTEFPDGFEFAGGTGVGVTHAEAAANGTIDIMITGFLY